MMNRHAHSVELRECLGAQDVGCSAGSDEMSFVQQREPIGVQAGQREIMHG